VSRAGRRGFTLLEVLVAVALLGLVVSVLAQSAIQGLGYEGDATRRMRASLLADAALWRIEAELKLGGAPKPVEQSEEIEEFRVAVDVQPLDPTGAGLTALLAPAPDAAGGAPSPAPAPGDPNGVPLPLFQIFVRVSWIEGLRELEVTRSTFAYDGSAVSQALGAGQEENAPAPPPEGEEEPS
jgi:prepilin-type N-terminal cleavage/methylation domain-containing protein